jgi:hypothetical protein
MTSASLERAFIWTNLRKIIEQFGGQKHPHLRVGKCPPLRDFPSRPRKWNVLA